MVNTLFTRAILETFFGALIFTEHHKSQISYVNIYWGVCGCVIIPFLFSNLIYYRVFM